MTIIINQVDNCSGIGNVTYDKSKNTLVFTIPPHVILSNIQESELVRLAEEHGRFESINISALVPSYLSYEINDKLIACCTWFSPAAQKIKKHGVVQREDYPYASDKKTDQCFNKAISGSLLHSCECEHSDNYFKSCNQYTPSEWSSVSVAYDDENRPAYTLQRRYVSFRLPTYQIIDVNGDVFSADSSIEEFVKLAEDNKMATSDIKDSDSYFRLVLQ